jgi:hypothetical protein
MLSYRWALPYKSFSFTPGFSPVTKGGTEETNRFNGFYPSIIRNLFTTKSFQRIEKPLKRFVHRRPPGHRTKARYE